MVGKDVDLHKAPQSTQKPQATFEEEEGKLIILTWYT